MCHHVHVHKFPHAIVQFLSLKQRGISPAVERETESSLLLSSYPLSIFHLLSPSR